METDHPEQEAVIIKEHRLWLASKQYIRGEITMTQLEEIECPHTRDLKEAVLALARGKLDNNVELANHDKKSSATH
jgi:hypothetical protein